jgi:E3 ubiquitin-protein ligase UBR3
VSTRSETEVLLNKGKRAAAAYIQAECARSTRPENLNNLLDTLLDPLKRIDEWETIEWCRWLMAGGCTPDEFSSTGRRDGTILWNILVVWVWIYRCVSSMLDVHLQ